MDLSLAVGRKSCSKIGDMIKKCFNSLFNINFCLKYVMFRIKSKKKIV